jgi:hypothetical protein
MRRRVWGFLVQADIMLSFYVGLPSMIRSEYFDCSIPRNLHHWELSESMAKLPPSRPREQATVMSYVIAKNKLLRGLEGVVQYLASLNHPADDYRPVLALDSKLEAAWEEIPQHLRPAAERRAEEPEYYSTQRVQLTFLYHQTIIVLHRRFLVQRKPAYKRSRERVLSSSLALLEMQAAIHREGKENGWRRRDKWWKEVLLWNDFILAGVALCLELQRGGGGSERGEIVKQLAVSRDIWEEVKEMAEEGEKVWNVLSRMLENIETGEGLRVSLPVEGCGGDGDSSTSSSTAGPSGSNADSPLDNRGMEMDWVCSCIYNHALFFWLTSGVIRVRGTRSLKGEALKKFTKACRLVTGRERDRICFAAYGYLVSNSTDLVYRAIDRRYFPLTAD